MNKCLSVVIPMYELKIHFIKSHYIHLILRVPNTSLISKLIFLACSMLNYVEVHNEFKSFLDLKADRIDGQDY